MSLRSFSLAFFALLCLGSVEAFSTTSKISATRQGGTTALAASQQENISRTFAVSAVAAAYLFANIATAPPAEAFDDFGSTQVIAGRSGGRAGGRSSSGGYRGGGGGRSSYGGGGYGGRSAYGGGGYGGNTYRSTTIVRPMIAPSPIIMSPYGYGGGFGGSPLGGFGMGYGLGAMQNRGDTVRDIRQEGEIQQEKTELEIAKARSAELEIRIKALEESSKQ